MPHESNEAGSPREWLRYAYSDLELARVPIRPKILLEGLCFHAHQASEKALKAVLISLSVQFPKTHNIRILLDLIAQHMSVPDEVDRASILTDYAVVSRCPGEIEPVLKKEYLEALDLAEKVVSWAENIV